MNSYNLQMAIVGLVVIALAVFGADPHALAFVSFVGAVVALKSTAITNMDAQPAVLNTANNSHGNIRESQGIAAISNGDSVGSTYRVARIRSSTRVSSIKLWAPDIGTTTAANVGVYDTAANGGAVVSASLFAAGQALNAGPYVALDVTFSALAQSTAEQRLWELLGLSADPMKDYDLALTLSGAADAAGNVVVRVQHVDGE